jgi:uncharacterized protein YjiS (DUF1127 family)
MSIISRAVTELTSTRSFAVVLRWLSRCGRAFALHWHRRAAIKSLGELDDRALRDIGLQRCQIDAAVRGEARRMGD